MYLTRSLIRTNVDHLLVPVTSITLASVKRDRMAVEKGALDEQRIYFIYTEICDEIETPAL